MEEKIKTERASSLPADLSTFILSLSASALLHLGEIENPEIQKKERNLKMAKYTIDIIEMLKEKTADNLDEKETALMQNILFDLKMRYCEAVK